MIFYKKLLGWGILLLVLAAGSLAQHGPFTPAVPYLADLTVRLTPFVKPLCTSWLLGEPGEQLCFAFPPSSALVWIVPNTQEQERSCKPPSVWFTLAPALPLRVRRCGDRLLWESWSQPLLPFEVFLGTPLPTQEDSTLLGRSQRELQELLESLAPNLFWVNRLIPFFEWKCDNSWEPWRPLPLGLGHVRSRLCQHEAKGWTRQWEVQP